MAKHLAVFSPDIATSIFSGNKKIDGRFSKIKIPPFGSVAAGDIVLVKLPGEDIIGQLTVDRVLYFDHPTKDEAKSLIKKYSQNLALPKNFFQDREKINYISLMFIKSVTKFLLPPQIPKKDLRPWVVLDN